MRPRPKIISLLVVAVVMGLGFALALMLAPAAPVAEAQTADGVPDRADQPDASFFAQIFIDTPEPFSAGSEIVFRANIIGDATGNFAFVWDMGDGNTRTGQVIRHTYSVAAEYTVLLRVQRGAEESTALRVIVVNPTITPTVCTPPKGWSIVYSKFSTYGVPTNFTFLTDPTNASVTIEWDFNTNLANDFATGRTVAFDYSNAIDASDGKIDKRWNYGKDNGCPPEGGKQCNFWPVATMRPVEGCEEVIPVVEEGRPVYMGDQAVAGLRIGSTVDTEGRTIISATVTAGTNVMFLWEYGDGEQYGPVPGGYSFLDDRVSSTFQGEIPSTGILPIRVTAYNSANSLTQSTLVPIGGDVLTIVDDSPKPPNIDITFIATGLESTANVTYAWDFGDPGKPAPGPNRPIARHAYAMTGKYIVKVTATTPNAVYTVGTIAYVGLPKPPQNVAFELVGNTPQDEIPEFDKDLTFCASITDAVSYAWDFGDGTGVKVKPDPDLDDKVGPDCYVHTYDSAVADQTAFVINLKVYRGTLADPELVGESDTILFMVGGDVNGVNDVYEIMLPLVSGGFTRLQGSRSSENTVLAGNELPAPTQTPRPATVTLAEVTSTPTATALPATATPLPPTATPVPTIPPPSGTIPLPGGTIPQP